MKKYLLYNGEKPFLFVAFAPADEQYAEQLLDQVAPLGYRLWFPSDGQSTSETFRKLESSRLLLCVLTEQLLTNAATSLYLPRAEALHKPILVYVPQDTPAVKEVILRLIKSSAPLLIFRPGEEPLTESKTAEVLLDPTLGLTPELAMKVYRHGVTLLDNSEPKKARELIDLAAAEGCPKAILWLGKHHLQEAREGRSDYRPAVEQLYLAAKAGDIEAIYLLGKMLAKGEGFERNARLAYTYISKSARNGYAPAQLFLAQMYDRGNGIEYDSKQAVAWYQAAAQAGETEACLPLAIRYLNGIEVPENPQTAAEYLHKSAESGNPEANLLLAKLSKDGIGVPRSRAEATRHFRIAAEAGICEAQYSYALCLRDGYGCHRDYRGAFYWMQRAASERIDGTPGSPDALYRLGVFYERGIGCKRNSKMAFLQYFAAAEQGLPVAMEAVSSCYRRGYGVPVNLTAADLFRRRAQSQKS